MALLPIDLHQVKKNILAKTSGSITTKYLTSVINLSFYEISFPSDLKRALVFSPFKDGPKVEENKNRPISLLILLIETFERARVTRIYEYPGFNISYYKQFDFRKNTQLLMPLLKPKKR